MTLNQTATPVASTLYGRYLDDCLRGPCQLPYKAPLPAVGNLQVYVDFGSAKPIAVTFYVQDTCTPSHQEQVIANNYVVGQTPEGNWYGVFKYFNEPVAPVTTFVLWLSAQVLVNSLPVERTYFSEHLIVEPCQPLTKIKACQPEAATTTGFDVNGLYYGLPVNEDFLGQEQVRYYHIAWVRFGKARELPPKATFTASLIKNFRTTVEKSWVLETEIVPRWYKDLLLAIYARGEVEIAGTSYLVDELAFEALNDDDLMWKPFANLKGTARLYFGCADDVCAECCSPQVLSARTIHPSESDSGSSSASASDSGSASESAGITPGEGNITVLANCGTAEHKITAIYWDPSPGGDPLLVGDLSDYPILPGESRTLSVVEFGTGDLDIQFDEDIFPLTVRIVDSEGNAQCGNSTAGPGTGNSLDFTGVTIDNTPVQQWTVELSCTPCE